MPATTKHLSSRGKEHGKRRRSGGDPASTATEAASAPPATPPPVYLVTGGTGFLGVALLHELVKGGCFARVLVRNSDPAFAARSDVELVMGDVMDALCVQKACRGVAGVFHLVGIVEHSRSASDKVKILVPTPTPENHLSLSFPLPSLFTHARMHARTHAHTHAHTHARTHAHTHTHTHNKGFPTPSISFLYTVFWSTGHRCMPSMSRARKT